MRALADAQAKYQEALTQKRLQMQNLADALGRREVLGVQATSPIAFAMENDYITGTKQRIIQADQGIVRATRGVEKALRNYLGAKRQLKAIESLREKHFAEFKRELAKREQKNLDDVYTMRARLLPAMSFQEEEETAPTCARCSGPRCCS